MDKTNIMSEENIEVGDQPVDSHDIPAVEPTPAPVPEPTPEPVIVEEQVAPVVVEEEPKPRKEVKRPEVNVSGSDKDEVLLSNCIYKNTFNKKSLTIHHLQRRLAELGYKDAYSDKDGWYGDLTKVSVEKFQADRGLNPTGLMDSDTFNKIFEHDPHVNIVL